MSNAAPADLLSAISAKGGGAVTKDIKDTAKANEMTKAAINGLGGPVFASMQDSKPVDSGLAAAQTQCAIKGQGGAISVPSEKSAAIADRAVSEALTQKAISSGSAKAGLTPTEKPSDGLSKEQLADLQAAAKAEKDRIEAAHTFGGGDTKTLMPDIVKDIEGQGGIISVPSDKAPKTDTALAHAVAKMKIESGKVPELKTTRRPSENASLNSSKLMMEIVKK